MNQRGNVRTHHVVAHELPADVQELIDKLSLAEALHESRTLSRYVAALDRRVAEALACRLRSGRFV